MGSVFLYGGCVIRDAYEYIKKDIDLAGYVARQSLISATTRPTEVVTSVSLSSRFQSRMVNGDLASNLLPTIIDVAQQTDLIVMDCHVERLGVLKLPDQSFCTPSGELQRSKALQALAARPHHIRTATDMHAGLWRTAATRFVRRLERYGLKDKLVVVNAPWAASDSEGVPFGLYGGRPVTDVSDYISSLTGFLREKGVKTLDMPAEIATAPTGHRWQRAPFHFGEEAMTWVADAMLGELQTRT
ncbi:DUF6270 domain-containing protein [Zhihengliuella halotolerans]|uniref:DUF6270 domain-containing protein n=1 Tax=Zhihengliuella halotolerans TaxID=370736 RepID=UPI0011AFB866|nr:DUF6270 domain-containing protein [Zhihengliuella halotolerans]